MKQFLRKWLGIENVKENYEERLLMLEQKVNFLENKLGYKVRKATSVYEVFFEKNKTITFVDKFNKLLEHLKLEWVDEKEETNTKPAHFKSKK